MNAGGQLAGLNFPNFTGFSGQVLNQGPDRDVNLVMIKAYNDWHVDEWCGAYPAGSSPAASCRCSTSRRPPGEVHRLAAKGCHAVTFSENPEALNMPSIHSGYWDPLFAAAATRAPCCAATSARRRAARRCRRDAPPSVAMTLGAASTIYTLVDLLWATFWERFPDLRFSLTEGDIGWIPYFLGAAEHVQRPPLGLDEAHVPRRRRPDRRSSASTSSAASSTRTSASSCSTSSTSTTCAGSRTTRTPTATGRTRRRSWPTVMAPLDRRAGRRRSPTRTRCGTTSSTRSRTRPKEQCTAAALRAESPDVDVVTRVGRLGDRARRRDLQVRPARDQGARVGDRA